MIQALQRTMTHSFGLDLTKAFEGCEDKVLPTDYTEVTFQLQKDGAPLKFAERVEETAGEYVYDNTVANTDLKLDAEGKMVAFGLEVGTYTLVETATADGYQLLDAITFTIEYTVEDGQLKATVTNPEDAMITANYITWGSSQEYHGAGLNVQNMKYTFNLPTTGGIGT